MCCDITPSKEQTLQCPSTQSQSKMRLYCSQNRDVYKQSDCITARNHTLVDFLHLSRNKYMFFLLVPQMWKCYIEPDDY